MIGPGFMLVSTREVRLVKPARATLSVAPQLMDLIRIALLSAATPVTTFKVISCLQESRPTWRGVTARKRKLSPSPTALILRLTRLNKIGLELFVRGLDLQLTSSCYTAPQGSRTGI